MANRTKWTPQKRGKFLKKLQETANVSGSARYAGLSRSLVYEKREADPEFAEAWDEAIEIAVDDLEAEARRRAFVGVGEPVFYKGVKCGEVQKYSDTLTIFLLKAHRPEKYQKPKELKHSGEIKGSGVLAVPMSVDKGDWDKAAEQQQGEMANGPK